MTGTTFGSRFVAGALILGLTLGTLAPAVATAATVNILPNPSVETANAAGTQPVGWEENHATKNTSVFTYPVAGFNSPKAVQVSVSKYATSDEGWYFDDVSVSAATTYTFADSYISTSQTFVTVRFKLSNGSFVLQKAVSIPATAANTWGRSAVTFTTPAKTVSVAILHALESTGTLTSDDYSLVAGSTPFPPTPAPVVTPVINSFAATPSSVTAGQSTTLAWSVTPISTLSIAGIGTVTGTSTIVKPAVTTSYVLTAGNGQATTTATTTVIVTPAGSTTVAPAITSFTATPSSIAAGQASQLAWTVTGSSSTLTLNGGVVTGTTTSVTPSLTTAYVLVSTNSAGAATSTVTVTVGTSGGGGGGGTSPTAPVINSFIATPSAIVSGNSSTLSWGVTGATSVSIDNAIGAVSASSTAVVAPTATTTYTLTAVNSTGTTTAQATVAVSSVQPAGPNLILNPTFAQSSGSNPVDWSPVSWGAASSSIFTYPVTGEDDNFAAEITIPTYNAVGEGNGSAEWLPASVPVTPGALYTFSDWYNSNTDSYVDAQWTLSDGTLETDSVATLGPTTGGIWGHDSEVFSAPTNAVALTMVHDIQSAGTLTVDNFSLTPGAVNQNTLSEAVVSLTFDDGWESQYVNALPILEAANLPATFYIITDAIRNSIYDFFTDPGEAIGTSPTADSVTWSPIYTDPDVQTLTFSDTYTAVGTSTIEADYTINDVASSTIIGLLPPGTNAQARFNFVLPAIASSTVTPISIMQSSNGPLTASAPSLIENITGYMTVSQLQALQTAGEEVASHTVTHPDLTALSTPEVTQELTNSRTTLLGWGATPVDGFAYPFGNYNSGIETLTAAAGYNDARTVEIGYNTKSTDKFALKTQGLVDTTPFSDVKSWIDTAVANKLWLVITFHDIDNEDVLVANGEVYGTTPQILQQIVSYLAQEQSAGQLKVETMHNALPLAQ